MDKHRAAVDRICASIHRFHETKTKYRIYHGSTNSTRHINFDRDRIVDVSSLNHVLSFDMEKKSVVVEPNVPMDVLVQETSKMGLLPPVVMEFPGITVGGGFVGTAGESSSFKHGFFDRTVTWVEMVLADGTVVIASEAQRPDLFHGLPGSFGTLGVLTLLEVKLVDMKKYVELKYIPTNSVEDAVAKTVEETGRKENDYIDGILFAKNKGAIIAGRLTDSCPNLNILQRFTRAWDPWFYLHAEKIVSKSHDGKPATEIVPLEDYLFRYDRGAFWTGMYAYKYFKIPFNRITRFLLDHFMHTRIMYHALHASGHTDRYFIQDILMPADHATEFINWIDAKFGLYPLWLCPLPARFITPPRNAPSDVPQDGYVNVGIWGPYPSNATQVEYVAANREAEAKVRELGGLKWLYARAYYTEDEFWEIYDENKYTALREKYHATALPTVYEKVREDPSQKRDFYGDGLKGMVKRVLLCTPWTRGVYGVYKATFGGDYLLSKKRS